VSDPAKVRFALDNAIELSLELFRRRCPDPFDEQAVVGLGNGFALGELVPAAVRYPNQAGPPVVVTRGTVDKTVELHLTKRARDRRSVDAKVFGDVRGLCEGFVSNSAEDAPCGSCEAKLFQAGIEAAFRDARRAGQAKAQAVMKVIHGIRFLRDDAGLHSESGWAPYGSHVVRGTERGCKGGPV